MMKIACPLHPLLKSLWSQSLIMIVTLSLMEIMGGRPLALMKSLVVVAIVINGHECPSKTLQPFLCIMLMTLDSWSLDIGPFEN